MIVKNCSLKDLRKRYNESRDFVIRIREDSNDIVYYNGIKAFEIDKKYKEADSVKLDIVENVYCLRYGGIESSFIDGKDRRESIDNLIKDTKELRENMRDYFNISIEEVKLKIGKSYLKDPENKIKEMRERLENIKEEISSLELDIDIDKVIENIKNNVENISVLKIDNNRKLSIEENLEIEKIFILNTIYNDDLKYNRFSGFKFPDLNNKTDNEIYKDVKDLDRFDEKVKVAIEKYQKSVRGEDEKKYQHLFMLSDKIPTKFKDSIEGLEPFEEEYYTKESKTGSTRDDAKGRIDCIFVKNNDTKEIFLIELKVDEKVVGNPDPEIGEHGINEHLKDIKDMLNEKKEEFLEVLIDRYNYRYQVLDEDKRLDRKSIDKIHFWTIIAYTNKKSYNLIIEKLNDLENNCKDEDLQNLLDPKEEITLLEDYKECDIRILFDKWDKEKISDEKFISLSEFYKNY